MRSFLSKLQKQSHKTNCYGEIKGWIVLNQSLLLLLRARKRRDFFNKFSLELMGANESGIFYLGSSLGQNFDFRFVKKKGMALGGSV